MAGRIRYMGNKDAIADQIAALVDEHEPDRPVVDLFCGMSSIAAAISPSGRPVWGNDVQAYAVLAARCQTASVTLPKRAGEMVRCLAPDYSENLRALKGRFASELAEEGRALRDPDPRRLRDAQLDRPHAGNDVAMASEVATLRASPETFPARLCALTFAWGYFGLEQAIVLDSIRFALDRGRAERALNRPQWEWGILALLAAASSCAASPGHFAQYLRGQTDAGIRRIAKQRRRDAWHEFVSACDELRPFGARSWRKQNRCYAIDALEIWPQLDADGLERAICYADPPYSRDQYSRYYHVLETLVRYDYPPAAGVGRYRPDRFQTEFSLKGKVREAFERLVSAVAARGHTLVLSYPSNGLFMKAESRGALEELLRDNFGRVGLAASREQAHSTMGARHGASSVAAEELLWIAA